MKISNKQYAQVLFDLVKDTSLEKTKKIVSDFSKLLIARHETWRLDRIISEFKALYNKEFKIIKAEINSFSPLDKKIVDLLLDYIKKEAAASEIEVGFKTDKNILGGVIIKHEDRIFDASLKFRLDKLKEKIIN